VECPVPSVKESESLRRGALGGDGYQLELMLFNVAISNDETTFKIDQHTVQWPDKPEKPLGLGEWAGTHWWTKV
jgi:hypothetical protein